MLNITHNQEIKMFILARTFLIVTLILFGAVHAQAYDPEHDNGATGVLDDDGDRNPGTVFPLDVTTCGGGSPDALCSEIASFAASTTGDIGGSSDDYYKFAVPTGGRIINIKNAPFNAVGNGTADDTVAFQKAFNFILSTLYVDDSSINEYSAGNPGGDNNYIIYVPDGTYKITDTVTYKTKWTEGGTTYRLKINNVTYGSNSCTDGEILYADSADDNAEVIAACSLPANKPEAIARVRIIGESRSGVIFQLANAATGFTSSGTPKPVIGFGNINANFNSGVSFNALRNVTINVGYSNPGAVGVMFSGANNSGISDVSIEAETLAKYGIYIKHAATQGYHRDINIENFRSGIYVDTYNAAAATFEHVTIQGSLISAIDTQGMGLSLRKILINNNEANCASITPAIKITEAAQVVLVDSTLVSGYSCFETESVADLNIAIDVDSSSHIHTRGIKVEDDASAYDPDYSNYYTGALQAELLRSAQSTLALQPKNPSEYDYTGLTSFILDDESDFEDCLDMDGTPCSSGTSYVLFFSDDKTVFTNAPHVIPDNIKVINFLYGTAVSSDYIFELSSSSSIPLVIEDLSRTDSSAKILEHTDGERPAIFRHVAADDPYANSDSGGSDKVVFFESVGGLGRGQEGVGTAFYKVDAEARGINTELCKPWQNTCVANSTYPAAPEVANFPVSGGSEVWVLGYKTEKSQPGFSLDDGADELEVLGGFTNQRHGAFLADDDDDDPSAIDYSVLVIKDSEAIASYIGFTSGIGSGDSDCTDDPEFHFEKIVREDISASWYATLWENYPLRTIPYRCNDIFIPLISRDSDNDDDTLDDVDEITLGTDPFNRLDPPRATLSREHLAVLDDKDYLNTDYARYIIWHFDEFQSTGPIDRTVDDVIAPGYTYGCVVDDGEVYCGDGSLTEVVKAQAGNEYSCALKSNGYIYCWYRADIDGTADDITGNLANLSSSIRDLAIHNGSDTYGCAVDGGNDYDCWEMDGTYDDDNPFTDYTSPSPALTSLTSVAVGTYHVCVINAGYIHCRVTDDTSYSAQLGDSDADGYVDISGTEITDARKIVAGDSFTCVLRGAYETGNGTVYCWGSSIPTVSGLSDPVHITALDNRLCVIDAGVTDQENAVNSLKCFPDLDTDGDSTLDGSDTDDDNDGVSDTTEGTNGTERVLVDTDGDDYCDGNGTECAGLTGNNDAYPLDPTQH